VGQFKVGMGIDKTGHNHAAGTLCSWLTIACDQVTGRAGFKDKTIPYRQSATCNRRLTGIVKP
jgi:hypothetical protein